MTEKLHLAVFGASLTLQSKSEGLDEMPHDDHDVYISSIKMRGKIYPDEKIFFVINFLLVSVTYGHFYLSLKMAIFHFSVNYGNTLF